MRKYVLRAGKSRSHFPTPCCITPLWLMLLREEAVDKLWLRVWMVDMADRHDSRAYGQFPEFSLRLDAV